MYKQTSFIIIFIFMTSFLFSESSVIQSDLQRFIRADLSGKIEILHEASSNAELNDYALQFVLDNHAQLDALRDMNTIVSISLDSLSNNSLDPGNSAVYNVLWKLFLAYPDSNIKADIIIALSSLDKGNRSLIDNLNNYLMNINQLFRAGETVDYLVVSACISAIMELGDPSSYPVLFSIICSGYPEVISSESYGALELIPGNLLQFLLSVIVNGPPDEKFAAFRAVINSNRLSIPERGQLAETALEQSLLSIDANVDMAAMRYAAVQVLTQLRWTRANTLAIRHYYRVQADYHQDIVSKERFLEAISCLGAVGNSDAALVLVLQLGLINARMFSTNVFDAEVMLAIVQSLGLIGDNAAFDHLLNVTNLPYTEDIIAAAREAISRLKW